MYSTQDDLSLSTERLAELTDTPDAVGVPDAPTIARLQLRANTAIDAALYGNYQTPWPAPYPAILTQIESDLWKLFLFENRDTMDVPPNVLAAAADSRKLLEAYRTKQSTLPGAISDGNGPMVGASVFTTDEAPYRRFGRCRDRLG